MAKTLKRKNKKLLKKKKFNKSRRFKKLSKKRGKRSKKKIKGGAFGAQRFGVMPALANTDVKKTLDEDENLVQIKNESDQTPLQRSSSFSSQGSSTKDFSTGRRSNDNVKMDRGLRNYLVGEPTLMNTEDIVKELKTRRDINELKAHPNPLRRLQGHLWGLMPRTQTENRLLQTANQSLSAASDTDLSDNRQYLSSSSSESPSFNDWDYNYIEDEGESKSESKTPLKTTEV